MGLPSYLVVNSIWIWEVGLKIRKSIQKMLWNKNDHVIVKVWWLHRAYPLVSAALDPKERWMEARRKGQNEERCEPKSVTLAVTQSQFSTSASMGRPSPAKLCGTCAGILSGARQTATAASKRMVFECIPLWVVCELLLDIGQSWSARCLKES